MSGKLDLFELTIKRGLENMEMPLDGGAWNEFEKVLHESASHPRGAVGTGGNFLSQFALAASILTGTLLFINYNSDPSEAQNVDHRIAHAKYGIEVSSDSENKVLLTESPKESSTILLDSDAVLKDFEQDYASENSSSQVEKASTSSNAGSENLSQKELDRIERINKSLQLAADKAEEEKDSSQARKKSTTRYVGEDFNLGASKSFSPNNDGNEDSFIPSSLKEGDLFRMTVSNESGRVLYTTKKVSEPWNGTDSTGHPVEEGRYYWEVTLQKDKKKEIFKGTVKLQR